MTLGERISAGRRAAGISQEALGERLGVSRQAISKWESDAAVPELEKLIALSRLFGVSLGALLGIEEDGTQPAAEELSGRELAAVEEIVGRYVAELEKKNPPRRLKRWQVAGIVFVALFLVWTAKGQLERVSTRIQNVENHLWSVKNDLSGQIYGLTDRLSELIERENSLVADWGYRLEEFDPREKTVTLSLWAAPKRVLEGTRAEFAAEAGEKAYTAAAVQDAPGRYSGRIVLPCDLEEELKLSIRFDHDGERQLQLLDSIWNLRQETGLDLWCSWEGSSGYQRDDGTFAFDGAAQVRIFRRNEHAAEPVSAQIELLKNGAAVRVEPVELPDRLSEGLDTGIELHQTVEIADGDSIDLVLHVVDSLGRSQYFLAIGFDVMETEMGWFDVAFHDAAQEWYDPAGRE